MKYRKHDVAEKLLRDFLDDEWNDALAALYGELELPDPLEPLAVAEKWLRARREDPVLLVSCARLSMRAELYGKARSYLETSLMIRRDPVTYQLLGTLLDELGEKEHAARVLHDGLAMAIGRKANLPRSSCVARRFAPTAVAGAPERCCWFHAPRRRIFASASGAYSKESKCRRSGVVPVAARHS